MPGNAQEPLRATPAKRPLATGGSRRTGPDGEPSEHLPAAAGPSTVGAPASRRAPAGAASAPDGEAARIARIRAKLARMYPDATTALHWRTPFELLVATILSAQTTDAAVNQVTPALFARCPTPEAMLRLSEDELGAMIRTIGLWRSKARNLLAACRILVERYGGQVPRTREALMQLPGVGRKTANVVLSNAFGIPAIAVDTHVFRVARRLGLASGNTPERVEEELMAKIPEAEWSRAHHWLIWHGRRICHARNPRCDLCALRPECPTGQAREPTRPAAQGSGAPGGAGSGAKAVTPAPAAPSASSADEPADEPAAPGGGDRAAADRRGGRHPRDARGHAAGERSLAPDGARDGGDG